MSWPPLTARKPYCPCWSARNPQWLSLTSSSGLTGRAWTCSRRFAQGSGHPGHPVHAYDSFQHDLKSIAADYYVVKSVDLTELKAKVALALEKAAAGA